MYSLAGSLIPVRLWVFTYVTWVVIATRDGEAGTVCAAASRTRRLADASSGPAVELGRLEREHVKRYMGNKLFISYGLELIYSITQRENQLEY